MSNRYRAREFALALSKLPPPIECFTDGAACPWCGAIHTTVTFGENECGECRHGFSFGYPPWNESDSPSSWVDFPHREFEAMGCRASVFAEWKPNDRLKAHYHQKWEEKTGIHADEMRAQ